MEGIKRAEVFGFGSSAGEERKEEKKKERETRNSEKERKRGGRLNSGVNLGQIENSRGSTAQFVFLRLPGKMGGRKEKGRGELDEQVETWDSFERKREGGGRGTIKTHLYASQFVITILVGAGP